MTVQPSEKPSRPKPDFSVMDARPMPDLSAMRRTVAVAAGAVLPEKRSPLHSSLRGRVNFSPERGSPSGTQEHSPLKHPGEIPGLLHSGKTPQRRKTPKCLVHERENQTPLLLSRRESLQDALAAISDDVEAVEINSPEEIFAQLKVSENAGEIKELIQSLEDKIFDARRTNKSRPTFWYQPKVLFDLQKFLIKLKGTNPALYEAIYPKAIRAVNLLIVGMHPTQQIAFLHEIFHNHRIPLDTLLNHALEKFFINLSDTNFSNYKQILEQAIDKTSVMLSELSAENKKKAVVSETREYIKYLLVKLESGEFISPIRYYHTTFLDRAFNIITSGEIETRHEKKYHGAFFSDNMEWGFGDVAISINPEEIAVKVAKITHTERRPIEDNDAIWMGFDSPLPITERIIIGPELMKKIQEDPEVLTKIRERLIEIGHPHCYLVPHYVEELFTKLCRDENKARWVPRQDASPPDVERLRTPTSLRRQAARLEMGLPIDDI